MSIKVTVLRENSDSYRMTTTVRSNDSEKVLERLKRHCDEMTQLTGVRHYGYIAY